MKFFDWQKYLTSNLISHALYKPLCIINLIEVTQELCVVAITVIAELGGFFYIIEIRTLSNDIPGVRTLGFLIQKILKFLLFCLDLWALDRGMYLMGTNICFVARL